MCAPVLVIWAVGNELGAGPIQITPGQNTILFRPTTQKPSVPGYITRFAPNLTYADGTVPRVDVLHLHHGVWVMRNYPTFADGKATFDSGELGYGPRFATAAANRATWRTPTTLSPGTYTYFCRVHPYMRGAFRVVSR